MSAEVNPKIGAQSVSMGADTRGSEPVSGDESGGPKTRASIEAEFVFGSNAIEYEASVVGSSLPSMDGTICSRFRAEAAAGVIS